MSIFWNIDSYRSVIEKPLGILTSGTVNCGNGVYLLKAGTPISNAGAVANTGDAKYLVAEDFYFYSNTPTQPKLVRLIETGYVDINAAEAAAGITYSDACKSALATAGIVLVDGALEAGGGGSGLVVAHATVIMNQIVPGENIEITLDKTFEELKAAGANSVIELGILADATATVPARFYYLHPLYALSADGTDIIMYGFSMSEGAAISVGVMTNEAMLMLEERDTVETVLVEATLGEGADNVYPVTAIDKDYYEIINAGICFARFNVDGITYTLPRVVYGYQEGAKKVLFAGSGSEMMLSFDNSTFDPENSSVTLR